MVEVFNNTLSENLIKEVKDHIRSLEVHRSNYTSWNSNIINNSSPVLVFDIENTLKTKILNELKSIINANDYSTIGVMYYYWTKFSYIPWHEDDASGKSAITIYMNEYWDANWGGYFAYETNNKIECIKPAYNTAVKIETPLRHTVFNVSIDAPIRETIQIFIK
jgi:hypothetical protein